ncbi:MAG: nitroreductase [Maricaulaceae bacterium]
MKGLAFRLDSLRRDAIMDVTDALARRRSCRAFRSDPVHEADIRAILDIARRAPSGGNLQPWKIRVIAGETRDALVAAVTAKLAGDPETDESAVAVYPPKLHEPYRTRRYELGEEMYALLGIPREDKAGRLARLFENYQFFDAPVGLFISLDKRFGPPQYAHLGMFLLAVELAAMERGLAVCMQEAWQRVQKTVSAHLGLAENEQLYCGMSIGYEDADAPVNRLRSTRVEVDEFTTFEGFPS